MRAYSPQTKLGIGCSASRKVISVGTMTEVPTITEVKIYEICEKFNFLSTSHVHAPWLKDQVISRLINRIAMYEEFFHADLWFPLIPYKYSWFLLSHPGPTGIKFFLDLLLIYHTLSLFWYPAPNVSVLSFFLVEEPPQGEGLVDHLPLAWASVHSWPTFFHS